MTEITKDDIRNMAPLMKSRRWRLENLYRIVNERGEECAFKLRPVQERFLKSMVHRNILLKARQLGFTSLLNILALDTALFWPNLRIGIIAHTRDDAAVIFRDKVKFAYDNLPDEIRKARPAIKNDAGELMLDNNSSIRVGTGFRSSTTHFLHVSEMGKICARFPERAREVITGSLPAVHAGSFLFIESTAEGAEGHFYEMCQRAQQDAAKGVANELSMKFHFFPWYENPSYRMNADGVVIPQRLTEYFNECERKLGIYLDQGQRAWYTETEGGAAGLGEDMLREHPTTPEEAFKQAVEGAYYQRQIMAAYQDGRIGEFPYIPRFEVQTAWDIGYDDSTSIWFYQTIGKQKRLIDFYSNTGEGLGHYVEVIKSKPYRYSRIHIAPHDIKVHEFTTGKTRMETALKDHGIMFQPCPDVGLMDGIDAVRRAFAGCVFDESNCKEGLRALENYRKEWDDERGVWKNKPRHDWASHPADAMRYAIVSDQGASAITIGGDVDKGAV